MTKKNKENEEQDFVEFTNKEMINVIDQLIDITKTFALKKNTKGLQPEINKKLQELGVINKIDLNK
tara:strand:+ start:453 stop:650 length:198 start_codon:yes stop_codon:yes gene_type:complete